MALPKPSSFLLGALFSFVFIVLLVLILYAKERYMPSNRRAERTASETMDRDTIVGGGTVVTSVGRRGSEKVMRVAAEGGLV